MATAMQQKKVQLSLAEQNWIKDHPLIIVGGQPNWAPYDFKDEQGQAAGITHETLKLIAQYTGLKFQTRIHQWHILLKRIKQQEIDLLPALFLNTEREKFLNFTQPYQKFMSYLFIHEQTQASSIAELAGKTLAIPKNHALIKEIEKIAPEINILEVDNLMDAIHSVLERKADILLDSYAVLSFLLKENAISTIKPLAPLPNQKASKVYMASRKDNPLLAQIVQKGLDAISEQEQRKIYDKWLGFQPPTDKALSLSQAEEKWLQAHPIIKFSGNAGWLPYEDFDEQEQYIGMVADYLKLLAERLNIEFSILKTANQTQAIDRFRQGHIDVLSTVLGARTNKFIHYSQPYLSTPVVIIMHQREPFVEDIEQIKNRSIATVEGYIDLLEIKQRFPGIDFQVYHSIAEGLSAVSTNQIEALLLPFAQINIYTDELRLQNIKIAGKSKFSTQMGFAVAEQMLPLINLINKAIESIEEAKKQHIKATWGSRNYIERTDYRLFYQAVVIFLVIILLVFIWNRRLSKEIKLRIITQQALNQTKEQAELAAREKSVFLARMSHEIRTHLNTIIGFSHLLHQQEADKRINNYANTINNSSHSLLELINDILDFSKIEAGKIQLNKTAIELDVLLSELMDSFLIASQTKNLQLAFNITADVPKKLKLDIHRFRQILVNLLSNAVKFTEQGKITLTVDASHSNKQDEITLSIKVIDTGIGIAKEHINNVFKEFEQVHDPSLQQLGGTGLGLAISKQLVETMGGKITVESTPGTGSVFSILFPGIEVVAGQAEKSKIKKTNTRVKFNQAKVLIVDDIKNNRILLNEILSAHGLNLLEAENGKAAIEMVQREKPDIILMDLAMPVMDGFQACKAIKAWADIPIIAISASTIAAQGTEQGNYFDHALKKPIAAVELIDTIKQFLPNEKITVPVEVHAQPLDCNAQQVFEKLDLFTEAYHAIMKNNKFPDIKKFSDNLFILAQQCDCLLLSTYATELQEITDHYDIAKLKHHLAQFTELKSKLKSSGQSH